MKITENVLTRLCAYWSGHMDEEDEPEFLQFLVNSGLVGIMPDRLQAHCKQLMEEGKVDTGFDDPGYNELPSGRTKPWNITISRM